MSAATQASNSRVQHPTEDLPLTDVSVTVAVPNRILRQQIVATLAGLGAPDPLATGNLLTLVEAVADGRADVLICDTDICEGDVCRLVREVRNGEFGTHPFFIAIVLVSPDQPERARKAIDVGADAVLVNPVTSDALRERLLTLAQRRRPFVATADYLGPDRRSAERSALTPVRFISPPNPMQRRLFEDGDDSRWSKSVNRALTQINEERMRWNAERISLHIAEILSADPQRAAAPEIRVTLKRMDGVLHDAIRRMPGTSVTQLTPMVTAVHQIVEKVLVGQAPWFDDDELSLLSKVPPLIERPYRTGGSESQSEQAKVDKILNQ